MDLSTIHPAAFTSTVSVFVCGQRGHELVYFSTLGEIMCNKCGLTLEEVRTGDDEKKCPDCQDHGHD